MSSTGEKTYAVVAQPYYYIGITELNIAVVIDLASVPAKETNKEKNSIKSRDSDNNIILIYTLHYYVCAGRAISCGKMRFARGGDHASTAR